MAFIARIAAHYHREVVAETPPLLYHWTEEYHALSILEKNEFHLTTHLGGSSDRPKGETHHFYYLSTTREPTKYNKGTAVFVLDGAKLAKDFHAEDFDYWGEEFRKISKEDISEYEERIWSDEPEIKAAKQYIRELHVYWWWYKPSHDYRQHRQLTWLAKKNGIPIFWYEDRADLRLLDKSKAKKFSDFPQPEGKDTEKDYPDRGVSEYAERQWMSLYNLYYAKSEDQLSKDAKVLLKDIGWHRNDILTRYMGMCQNARSLTKYRPFVAKLVKILKKENLRSVAELLDSLNSRYNAKAA